MELEKLLGQRALIIAARERNYTRLQHAIQRQIIKDKIPNWYDSSQSDVSDSPVEEDMVSNCNFLWSANGRVFCIQSKVNCKKYSLELDKWLPSNDDDDDTTTLLLLPEPEYKLVALSDDGTMTFRSYQKIIILSNGESKQIILSNDREKGSDYNFFTLDNFLVMYWKAELSIWDIKSSLEPLLILSYQHNTTIRIVLHSDEKSLLWICDELASFTCITVQGKVIETFSLADANDSNRPLPLLIKRSNQGITFLLSSILQRSSDQVQLVIHTFKQGLLVNCHLFNGSSLSLPIISEGMLIAYDSKAQSIVWISLPTLQILSSVDSPTPPIRLLAPKELSAFVAVFYANTVNPKFIYNPFNR